jgi:predicted DNA-binding transcriptional regulator AlpA
MSPTTKTNTNRGRALRLRDMMHLTGASRPTIWRWSKSDPTFPKPFHLSPAITCWDEGEVLEWIEAKKVGRSRQPKAIATKG